MAFLHTAYNIYYVNLPTVRELGDPASRDRFRAVAADAALRGAMIIVGLRKLRLAGLVAVAACAGSPADVITPRPEIPPGPYQPGSSYFGRNQYIEYIAGDLPVIFSAPHGGTLVPVEIPDRVAARCGGTATTGRDLNTQEQARAVGAAFLAQTGRHPHIIINRLHRSKLDANRDLTEAACSDEEAGVAFEEFHAFLSIARDRVLADHGRGWYTDLHGHGHAVQRIELGYLLEAADLRESDPTLDGSAAYEDESSLRTFSQQAPSSFAALLRGPTSLGSLLFGEGFPAVPSSADPAPAENQPYFSGGFNTATYACSGGGAVCGVQIESYFTGVRDSEANRASFAAALARVYASFLEQNFGIVLPRVQ